MTTQNHRGDKMERNETVTKVVEEEVVKGTLWKCGTVCPRRITDKKMTRKERECKEEKRQRKERKVQGIVKVRNSMIRKITKQYKIKILQIKYDHVGTKRGRDFWKCGTIWSRRITNIFFWTMLRASLQLWQSLNCASNVIVRQRDQKERSVTKKNKATKPTKAPNQQTPKPNNRPVPDQSSKRWNQVKQAQALTQTTIPGSHNVFSRK